MSKLKYKSGTIVRFLGTDGEKKHMGFVVNETKVMELIHKKEGVNSICRIYLTDVNEPHPLTNDRPLDRWSHQESAPSNWSMKANIHRVESAYKEFNGSEYNLIHNNCQHFAYNAVHGFSKSPDSDNWSFIPAWLVGDGGSMASSAVSSELLKKYRNDASQLIQQIKEASKIIPSTPASKVFGKVASGVIESFDMLRNTYTKEEIPQEIDDQTMENTDSSDDLFKKLEELKKLKDQGIITEDEFQSKKKEILSRM
jgi:hypothetical protein